MDNPATDVEFNVEGIRKEFPILHQEINGYPFAYFDNAATTQKPASVIESITNYYTTNNSNIHRGIHTLAERATTAFEQTRTAVQEFINAPEKEEIIFTKGTSDSINLVASTLGRQLLAKDDEVIISGMEHHSNIVPWQLICEEKEATLKIIPVNDDGEIEMDSFKSLLSEKTKIVSVVFASNTLGTINPVEDIVRLSHEVGAKVLLDAAQAMAHLEVDVRQLNCDFLAFSGHKMYGPTGVGVLFGKRRILESMPPYQGGGEMIKEVSFSGTTFADIPYKFEAGTPNIADVIALKEAILFIQKLGKPAIHLHESKLLDLATKVLSSLPRLKIYANIKNKVPVVSFTMDNMHPFDAGMLLDSRGIAVRTGHHCTQPLMARFGIEGTIRASFSVYNTLEEINRLGEAVESISER
jgi:cysteine desulfurase / selenocysteine lyase